MTYESDRDSYFFAGGTCCNVRETFQTEPFGPFFSSFQMYFHCLFHLGFDNLMGRWQSMISNFLYMYLFRLIRKSDRWIQIDKQLSSAFLASVKYNKISLHKYRQSKREKKNEILSMMMSKRNGWEIRLHLRNGIRCMMIIMVTSVNDVSATAKYTRWNLNPITHSFSSFIISCVKPWRRIDGKIFCNENKKIYVNIEHVTI